MGKGVESICRVAEECGACQHIDVPYDEQLKLKDARIRNLFDDNVFGSPDIRPIIGMEHPFHYRNKVVSPFAPDKRRHMGARGGKGSRAILTGMYAAGTHKLVRTDGCLVENEQANQVIREIRSIMVRHGIEPYDENTGRGFMRHAIVRVGHESGEVLVTLVTNDEQFPSAKAFCRQLVKRCPFITSIVQNVNTRRTNVILGQREQRLYGPGFILDTLCGLSFRISSQSFYQVNAVQTEVLYEQAMKLAGLRGPDGLIAGQTSPTMAIGELASGPTLPQQMPKRIVDAYCGTGTIGLVAATRGAAEVIGVDSVASAIEDARQNARHNGVENARFVAADATAFMRELADAGEHADIVLMDPPRAGSTPEFLDALAALAPACVVYISCNPDTQARDLRHLVRVGYRIEVVQPVDMFPHTDHIETVVLLRGEKLTDISR